MSLATNLVINLMRIDETKLNIIKYNDLCGTVITDLYRVSLQGPFIKYVKLFLANFGPPPSVTHPQSTSHISDPPINSRPSTKAPFTNSLSIIRGVFVWGGLLPGKVLFGVVFVRSSFC